jgi:hypothetical protein
MALRKRYAGTRIGWHGRISPGSRVRPGTAPKIDLRERYWSYETVVRRGTSDQILMKKPIGVPTDVATQGHMDFLDASLNMTERVLRVSCAILAVPVRPHRRRNNLQRQAG